MLSLATSTAPELHVAAATLRPVLARSRELSVPVMLVGALARDVLAHHALQTTPGRATKDVDIAVSVRSWAQISQLTAGWERDGRSEHTFLVGGVQLDVVPFDGVETPERTVRWRDDNLMNLLGFAEALTSAEDVELPGGVVVLVPSLPAQSVLKLVAWSDRGRGVSKDAQDLRVILRAYHQGRYFDELYTDGVDVLELHDFDHVAAGADLLGRRARALLSPQHQGFIADLLGDGPTLDRLCAGAGRDVAGNRTLFEAYRAGWEFPLSPASRGRLRGPST